MYKIAFYWEAIFIKSKFLVRFFLYIITISLLLSSFNVSAETKYQGKITVDTVKAITGDSVIVKFDMENNPGIMAMTISITYDSSALEYDGYYKGYVRDYTIADHPDKNLVRLVNCEIRNRKENGTMFSFKFKIKDNAEFGFHKIGIDYNLGDFCNWNLDKIMPEVISGGVDVGFNGNNCPHKEYGKWTTVAEPTCLEPGARQHTCLKCGHVEIEEIPALGHDFENKWTIDKEATPEAPGSMSRHCTRCDAKTDILSITYEQYEQLDIDNSSDKSVKPSDIVEKLMKQQHPDVDYKEITKKKTSKESETKENINNVINKVSKNPKRLNKIKEAIPNLKTIGFFVLILLSVVFKCMVF